MNAHQDGSGGQKTTSASAKKQQAANAAGGAPMPLFAKERSFILERAKTPPPRTFGPKQVAEIRQQIDALQLGESPFVAEYVYSKYSILYVYYTIVYL